MQLTVALGAWIALYVALIGAVLAAVVLLAVLVQPAPPAYAESPAREANDVGADTPTSPSVSETDSENGESQVFPRTESDDASLSSLTVDDVSVAGFDPEVRTYEFGLASTKTQVTIEAIAADSNATVEFRDADDMPLADADDVKPGHQVDLSPGSTTVKVRVTADGGVPWRVYTVNLNLGSDEPFGWKAEDDFDTLKAAGNIRVRGIWSDGTTMWVADDDPQNEKLFAYTLATKQRNPNEDFNTLRAAGNRSIRGLWSDGTTMWVVEYYANFIYAYSRTSKERDQDEDFVSIVDPQPRWSWGLWSDGATLWIAGSVFTGVYAYDLVSGERDSDKDVSADGNGRPGDIWSDGTTMWVVDTRNDRILAYSMDTGQRDSVRDFSTLSARHVILGGIWSDGTTMWVADQVSNTHKIFAYNMPGNPDLSALNISDGTLTPDFHRLTTSYTASVEFSVSTITVTADAVDAGNATVEFLDADDMPLADADDQTDGQQVNLVVGENTIKVKVTADDGVVNRTYTMTVTREPRSTHLSALSVDGESVAGFDAETASYEFGVDNTVTQVTISGVPRDSEAAVTYSGTDADDVTDGHQVDLVVGANSVTVTVTDSAGEGTRDYTVNVNRGSDEPFGWRAGDDIDTLKAAGNTHDRGMWSDGTTMWVGDDDSNKLFAYTLATGQRNPDEDFDTLDSAGNGSIRGLWSDGTTMWVVDWFDHHIFAYSRTTKERDRDEELVTLEHEMPSSMWGIWSDGATMWIADDHSNKIFAYDQIARTRDAKKDFSTVGNEASADIWSDGTTIWVAEQLLGRIVAYALDTGQRDPARDFNQLNPGHLQLSGIWSDGEIMWVGDDEDDKIYAYNMPGNPDLSALSLSAGTLTPTLTPGFHRVTTSYAASVQHSVSTITVNATAVDAGNAAVEFLDADDMPLDDADDMAAGQQVNLDVGIAKTIKVKVTADDGVVTRTYTLIVTREAPTPVKFESSTYDVDEGESVTVTVSLGQALSGQVVVPLNVTDGSGITAIDYSGVPTSVTIEPGEMSASFSFNSAEDSLFEADEEVSLAFGTLPEAVTAGVPAATTVTIVNDDEPDWTLSASPASIAEADTSSSSVTVSSGGVTFDSAKTINLSFAGSATKDVDYSVAAESLTLAAGRSSVSTTVSALDDSVLDTSETIQVAAMLDGSTIGAQQTIAVVDDEQAATGVVLEVSPTAVDEDAGTATLTVTGRLDGSGLTTDLEVSLTLAAGTATEGDDYTVGSTTATLSITVGAVSGAASFSLTLIDDRDDDDDETVTIAASSTSTLTLSPTTLTVTITDNDDPNIAPMFDPPTQTRTLEENSGPGVDVGAPVTATDANNETLTYSLGGADAGSFRIDSASGQISTAPGVAYDYEASKNSYALTVTAEDTRGGRGSASVTIEITDVDEPPPTPRAPRVSPTDGATDSLDVSWSAPSMTSRPALSGYKVRYNKGDRWNEWLHTGTGVTATIDGLDPGARYEVQVRAVNNEGESPWSLSGSSSTFAIDDPCLTVRPTPTVIPVTAVPIVVPSTTDVYFVLYVTHIRDGAEILTPVSVTLGQAGTTTLGENVEALPAARYRVERYNVDEPADIDGDCEDDLTELRVMGRMNPLNAAPSILRNDGAVAIPDGDIFDELSYTEPDSDYEYVKFAVLDIDTDQPLIYFINSVTHVRHPINLFLDAIGHTGADLPSIILGEIVYDPDLVASDGTQGDYYYWLVRYDNSYTFDLLDRLHTMFTASMPLLGERLRMHIPNRFLPRYQADLEALRASRIPLLFNEELYANVEFLALNAEVGFGFLRVMQRDERPSPLNIVIYESLPNELPRVGGIITTVPQTPLSHVNLRAVQDNVPNAYIKDALEQDEIDDLIDSYVRYEVTADGYKLRDATLAEVNAHHAASRPARVQVPERDLSVKEITPLSEIEFDDWRAFGVKAANVAVLGTMGFPTGTVPEGFAIPFYFYDQFMNNAVLADEKVFGKGRSEDENDKFTMPAGTKLIDAVQAILAHPRFQTDFEMQDEMLDDLREVIEEAESPQWMIDALTAMHAQVHPPGRSLRYRSSTNNEDLPNFSGAGLYDSNTQKQSETENEGIDKSMKQVFASLWNFRAFVEREFHRIDHLAAAMGVLVHPNYSDELANGVAASFDPINSLSNYYYLNTQLGEDLVTNPDANSEPEEILLHRSGDYYEILATSNQVPAGALLMTDAQMKQLAEHLTVIHTRFKALYDPAANQPFAIEIEFKITEANILAIKQARPWVFGTPRAAAPTTAISSGGGGGGGGGGAPAPKLPSDEDFDYNLTRDIEALDPENDLPTGMWSDGGVLWIVENSATEADRLFAYDLSSGERLTKHEFELERRNRFSHGIWSDGQVVWIADSGQDILFAYKLETGERLVQRDIELSERNRDPRGIWSDETTIWVLDSGQDALFAYNLETGALLAEYPLDKLNKSPRGIWSDGVTLWVSDDGAKRLFAYELSDETLKRNDDLEFSFRPLIKAGNSAPRGIWSDGDVMYVVDEQDDRVYTYNIPDATIALLASLSLTELEIGTFALHQLDYSATAAPGLSTTAVMATAVQEDATVVIEPEDADGDLENGHQVNLGTKATITITVKSADGSRTRSYKVVVDKPPCLEGVTDQRLSEVVFVGGSVGELETCARSLNVDALYHHRDGAWTALFLSESLPGFLSQSFRARFAEGLPSGKALIAVRRGHDQRAVGTADSN